MLKYAVAGAILLGLFAAVSLGRSHRRAQLPPAPPPASAIQTPAPVDQVQRIRAERRRLDETVWAPELQAQAHEATFIALWDAMRERLDDQHLLLMAVPFERIAFPGFGPAMDLGWRCTVRRSEGTPATLDHQAWERLLTALSSQGYVLEHSEWHHAAFDPFPDGTAHSQMAFKLFVHAPTLQERLVVSGTLEIAWSASKDSQGRYLIRTIDAKNLVLTTHRGTEAFQEAWSGTSRQLAGAQESLHASVHESPLDPVLVYDLDGDGRDDIILPSINTVLINRSSPGTIRFERRTLCRFPFAEDPQHPGSNITAAALADLDGDGHADLVVAGYWTPPVVYYGDGSGIFTSPGVQVSDAPASSFQLPTTITVGDYDGDGRPDLWIGQYRTPYLDGNIPARYWDADDGYPSFLLRNLGNHRFEDVTVRAHLDVKRHRRNYSASFHDFTGDGRLDLVTVNDFAGVDLFHNNGDGTFTDISETAFPVRNTYGMSHAIADFNGEGVLDLFVAGMSSTTARRLDYMKLGRSEFAEYQKMRLTMAYGNRLYLGSSSPAFTLSPVNDQLARTGWTWGNAPIDVENEGLLSLFVANGHRSGRTAKDYCTRFWTQDIYPGANLEDSGIRNLISEQDLQQDGVSWNGFEHKGLLKNQDRKGFTDVAYPMGLGFEWDGREVVADDFDGDGKVDLLIMENRITQSASGPGSHQPSWQVLHVERNCSDDGNHWLDVRLVDNPVHSILNARIEVVAGGMTRAAAMVTGDSYRSQHAQCQHFGLGRTATVDEVRVRWRDGAVSVVTAPPVDRTLVIPLATAVAEPVRPAH